MVAGQHCQSAVLNTYQRKERARGAQCPGAPPTCLKGSPTSWALCWCSFFFFIIEFLKLCIKVSITTFINYQHFAHPILPILPLTRFSQSMLKQVPDIVSFHSQILQFVSTTDKAFKNINLKINITHNKIKSN